MKKQHRGYIVSDYTTEVNTDQKGPMSLTRWHVSQIDKENSEVKRIIQDGFHSEAQATEYANSLYDSTK